MTDKSDKNRNDLKDNVLDDLIDALDDWDIEDETGGDETQQELAPGSTSTDSVRGEDAFAAPRGTSSAPLYAPPVEADAPPPDEDSTALIDMRQNRKYLELVRSTGKKDQLENNEADAPLEPAEAEIDPSGGSDADLADDAASIVEIERDLPSIPAEEHLLEDDSFFSDEPLEDHDQPSDLVEERSHVADAQPPDSVERPLLAGAQPLVLEPMDEEDEPPVFHAPSHGEPDTVEIIGEQSFELEPVLEPVIEAELEPVLEPVVEPELEPVLEPTVEPELEADTEDAFEPPQITREFSPPDESDLPAGLVALLDGLAPKTASALQTPTQALPPTDDLLDDVLVVHAEGIGGGAPPTPEELALRCEESAENSEEITEVTTFLCEASRIRERRLGDFQRARELCVLALQLNPGHSVALAARRRQSFRAGAFEGLADQIDAELFDPHVTAAERRELLLLKAEILMAVEGDVSGALEVFRELETTSSDDVRVALGLATIASRDGDDGELAKQLVTISKNLPEGGPKSAFHTIAGGLFESLGDTVKAATHFEAAVQFEKAGPAALAGVARARIASDKPREAAESLVALAEQMGDGPARNALIHRAATLLSAHGNADAAIALLEEPQDRYHWATLFDSALSLGDRSTACRALRELAESVDDPVLKSSYLVELVLRGASEDRERTREMLDSLLQGEVSQPMVAAARAELARREEETATLAFQEAGNDASPIGLFRAALMVDRRGRTDEALQWVERAKAAPTSKIEAGLVHALMCAVRGDWQAFAELLHGAERNVESESLRAASSIQLGQISEYRLKDNVGARAGYARAQDIVPAFLPALIGLVRSAADPSARHRAARNLAESCAEFGEVADLFVVAGMLAEEAGENGAALESYSDALALDPAAPLAVLGAERLHRRMGGTRELIELWSNVAAGAKGGLAASSLVNVARAQLESEDQGETGEALAAAFDIWHEDLLLADSLVRLGWSDGTEQWLDKATEILSLNQSVAALIKMAEQVETVDPEQALDWYRKALDLTPGRLDAKRGVENALVQLGHGEKLEAEYQSALEEDGPERAVIAAREKLIELAGLRGDAAVETERREELLELDSSHMASLHWLAATYLSDRRWADLARIYDLLAHELEDASAAAGAAAMAIRLQSMSEKRPYGFLSTAETAHSKLPEDVRALLNLYQTAREDRNDELVLLAASGLAGCLGRPRCRAVFEIRAAEALEKMGRSDEAEEALVRAGESGDHPVAWWRASRLAESSGRFVEAAHAAEVTARLANSTEHRVDEYLRAGRIWLERVGDASKALVALQGALEVDPDCQEAFELARLAMQDESADPRVCLDLIIGQLTDESPAEEVIELGTKGAALALGLGETESAKELLAAVLVVDPGNIDSVRQLADICEQDGDWQEATACLAQLAHLTTDDREKENAYLRYGAIAHEKLGDTKQAIQALQQVLAISPQHIETLRRLAMLLPGENRWKAVAEVNARLSDLESEVDDKRDALLRLAQAFEVGLNDPMRAQMSLDQARRLRPTDMKTMGALVQYFRRQGQDRALKVHLDLAAGEYGRILEGDPCDESAYHALFQVYAWQGHGDGARSAAAVLSTFGVANDEELELLSQHGGVGWQPGPAAADIRLDEHLCPPAVTPSLRTLFSRIGDYLTRLHPQTPKSLKLGRNHRVGRGQEAYELAQGMVSWYGLRDVEVYVHPTDPSHWSLLASSPPALVLGQGLLSGASPGELRFLIGRGLAIFQRRLTILHQLDRKKVALLLPAIVKTVAPAFEVEEVDEVALAELTREVSKAIPKKIRPELGPFALECLGGLQSQESDLRQQLVEFADRSGLLASGGLMSALAATRRLRGTPLDVTGGGSLAFESVSSDLRSGALLRFFVSPEHSAVREKLGLAFPI